MQYNNEVGNCHSVMHCNFGLSHFNRVLHLTPVLWDQCKNSVVKIPTAESRRLEGVLNRGSEYRDGTQTPAVTVSYRQARDGRTVV